MKWLLMAVLALGLTGYAYTMADDAKATGPKGTWTWTVDNNGKTRTSTLKLDMDKDGKLTGVMVGRNNAETKIDDAKFDKDKGEITFTVTRDRNGTTTKTTYTGTLKDDTIKFKTMVGDKAGMEFEAKRTKEEKKDDKKDK
jgi:hypothetical protein